MGDSAGTSGMQEQPRKRLRADADTDYTELIQQHMQLQQQQRQQQQQQEHQQQLQQQQQNAFCGPGSANNFQAFMNQALQMQQAQFNAFCQQMSLTGPLAAMMQHMQQLARFPMPGPMTGPMSGPPGPMSGPPGPMSGPPGPMSGPPGPMSGPPPMGPLWPQPQQQANGMSQQQRQPKRGRRPKKGQGMPQNPGFPQGQKPGFQQGQKAMPPKAPLGPPQAGPPQPRKRCVATWTCSEPDGPPRSYCSDKRWTAQRRVTVTDMDGQCPFPFLGRTVSDFLQMAPNTIMPPDPKSRYCDVCGGLVLYELRHKESKRHREALELDVSLICARIRRDPAFAAAVISAARECIETTGVAEADSDMSLVDEEDDDDDCEYYDGDGGDKYKDDDEPPPPEKKGSDKPSNQKASGAVKSSSADDFGFLENEVFRRVPDAKKLKGEQGK